MDEESFFRFINFRHRIYVRKEMGLSKPWSDDPIFQNWKFCNIFRRLDKTTVWLIDNVINPHIDDDPTDLMFNLFAFRAYNRPETYQYLGGWVQGSYNAEVEEHELEPYVAKGNQLISGAYMLRGYKGQAKWQSIPAALEKIWDSKRSLYEAIRREKTLENACESIRAGKYWGWGPFTAYQVALDMTYSPVLGDAEDLNTWCAFGPGAMRGISILYPGIKKSQMIERTQNLLAMSPEYLAPHVPALNLQDIEFSLCEYGKYERIKNGGRGKERYNGK